MNLSEKELGQSYIEAEVCKMQKKTGRKFFGNINLNIANSLCYFLERKKRDSILNQFNDFVTFLS